MGTPWNLRWRNGRASVETRGYAGPVDFVFRFFPGEWLPNLPRSCGWRHFFAGGRTPVSNPAYSLITQSKRFPLAWRHLSKPLATWRATLPETRDPRDLGGRIGDDWVLKPALGRVGEDIGIAGVTPVKDYSRILKDAARRPHLWAAQKRFEPVPFLHDGKTYYPCIGVYTVDGRAAGAYGRLTESRVTDYRAMESAVLVERNEY
jgi:glutathionylspermidine synthase